MCALFTFFQSVCVLQAQLVKRWTDKKRQWWGRLWLQAPHKASDDVSLSWGLHSSAFSAHSSESQTVALWDSHRHRFSSLGLSVCVCLVTLHSSADKKVHLANVRRESSVFLFASFQSLTHTHTPPQWTSVHYTVNWEPCDDASDDAQSKCNSNKNY